MFLPNFRFIFYLLIYFFWLFSAQGVEIFAPHPTSDIDNDLCITNQDNPLDCEEQPMDDLSEAELDQLYKDYTLEYFFSIILENTDCKCQGNDGCTRGCRPKSHADRLERDQYPPFTKCTTKKSIRHSSDHCAKHVTGAIMTVLNDLLDNHCKNTEEEIPKNITNYLKCLKNFKEDVKNDNISICRHSFKFRYAFCMLNLDGQNAQIYNSISDKTVRSICKAWAHYNQTLLTMNIPLYNGEIIRIPIFNRIPSEQNKEFQKDPSKIPKGAIIVVKSAKSPRFGHVEVKTDRNECGEDKTQTCFCSDYCRERSSYNRPVLAVFEWNPEFIRYTSTYNTYLLSIF